MNEWKYISMNKSEMLRSEASQIKIILIQLPEFLFP